MADEEPDKPRWWAPFAAAADALPPAPAEAAVGTLLGAVAVAVTNAAAIAIMVPWPAEGLGLRLLHHGFDLLEVLAVAVWLAAPLQLWARLAPKRWSVAGWWLYGVLSTGGMYAILHLNLQRQATAILDGKLYAVLYPTYVVMCGLAVLAGYFVGGFFGGLGRDHHRAWRVAPPLIGTIGMVVGHAILRDDYPGVHAAILWVAATVFGMGHVDIVRTRLRSKPTRRAVLVGCAVVATTGVAIAPPNDVRVQLFREPGAVAPWVLAQLTWRLPAVNVVGDVPTMRASREAHQQRALLGFPQDPVVVMVTVDALRADVVDAYNRQGRFPWLKYLTNGGVHFRHASSPGSQTSVSLTSLFSGRYYSQLRWSRFGEGKTRFLYAADDQTVRWPQLLSDAGVETHSVLGLIFLQSRFGVARGFEHERVVVTGRRHGRAPTIMRPLLSKLAKLKQGPAFLYAHLMEPHEPYNRGRVREGSAWERYLSEVDVVDHWLGQLVDTMKRHHRRRGIIIVSADHGEAFGEHGTKFHTKTLYQELVHVPLIFWGAGLYRRVVDQPVGLVDVGPTVLHMFRQPAPADCAGVSLLPLMRVHEATVSRPVFIEGRLRRGMYTDDGLKVIEDTVRKVVEVYDLNDDPGELHNLFGRGGARVDRAVAQLRAWYQANTLRKDGYEPPYKP